MKTLVVYYSRTGHTRQLAERLAHALDADLAPITELGGRQGLAGYRRSLCDVLWGRDVPIQPLRRNPAQYDLVLVGTPVWAWRVAAPVRAFARRHGRSVRRTAFFCTAGGSGQRSALDQLRRLMGRVPVAELALSEAELQRLGRADVRAKVRQFTDRLAQADAAPLRAAA